MDAACSSMSERNDPNLLPEGFKIDISKNQPVANKMFIGGISYISKQALLEYLSQFGEILDFIVKIHPSTGTPRGFGFVLFKDNAAVEKVLQVKEHRVCGKAIGLRRANNTASKFRPKKVFVGGVNPRMPEEKIRAYFGTFGVITNIDFPVYPNTNKRRAFCFISYTEETAVRSVLENKYHYIGAARCEVKLAYRNENPRLQMLTETAAPVSEEGNAEEGNAEEGNAEEGNAGGDGELPANPDAGRVDQNVCGADGGGEGPSTALVPVPPVPPALYAACNQGFAFPAGSYVNYYNVYTNQQVFNPYSGQYFLGYNYGAHPIGAPCTYCNGQINPVAPFGTCVQIYQLY